MECVSGMWGVKAGLRQLFRGVGIHKGLLFRLRLQSCSRMLSGQCSLFFPLGPSETSGLGRCLDPFIYFSSVIPRGKGHRHRLFILFGARGSGRRLEAGSWKGLGSGALKWGADTVPCLSIISHHLLKAPGVCEIDFGLFRKSTSRPRNRPRVGVGVSEPPSLLGCGRLELCLIL